MNGFEHAAVAMRRLGLRIIVLGVVLALFAVAGVAVFIAMTALMTPATRSAGCVPDSSAVPVEAAGGTTAGQEQLANAAVIVATGRELGVPERGLWVALGTALQESGLRNLDYGDRDSLGLFQQRPSQGWGSPAQVRDPRYASTQFFQRLVAVPGWVDMPLWQAAQTVQRSAFPLAYAKWEQTAADILAAVGTATGIRAATYGCAPEGSVAALEGAASGCTEDDPTTAGCVTPTTSYALAQAEAALGGLRNGLLIRSAGCFAQRPANSTSDHPLGKGCDLFPGQGGRFANAAEVEKGWRAAGWLRTNAEALGVSYVIWQGRIWAPGDDDVNGWGRRYTGGGVYDPLDAVGGHYDHIHVSFSR